MERKYKKIVVFEHFVKRTVPLIAPTGKYGKLKCNMVGERCLKVEHTDRQAEIQGTRTKVELQTGLRELLPQRQAGFLTWQQVLLEYTEENRPYYQTILRVLGRKRLWEVLGPAFQNMQDNIAANFRRKTLKGLSDVMGEALQRQQKNGVKLAQIVMEALINDTIDTTPQEIVQEIESAAVGVRTGVMLKLLMSEQGT